MSAVTEQAPLPTPDHLLPRITHSNLHGYTGPTTTPHRMAEAELLATARSTLHPMYRRSPGDCLTLLHRAEALDVPVGLAIDHVYINTAIGRAGLSAQLMAALLLRAGIRWTVVEETDQVVRLRFRRGRKTIGTVSWRIREAVAAGLTRREHWRLWPTDCLWARAMARACRRYFSDIVMGLAYTPEEVYDMGQVDTAPDEVETLAPEVQDVLAEATDDDVTAAAVRDEIIPRARKAKLLRVQLPDGRTVEQALNDAWLAAAGREDAARADAALAQLTPPLAEVPADVLDAPAGEGALPCDCPTSVLVSGQGHVRGVCRGALVAP
jgi:hypothetical protein